MFLLGCAAAAGAHPGHVPTLSAEVRIGDGAVRYTITGNVGLMQAWFGAEPTNETAAAVLDKGVRIEIDGMPVVARVERVGDPAPDSGFDKYLFRTVVAVLPCTAPPQRIATRWRWFEGADWQTRGIVPANIRAGPATRTIEFSKDEPEFVWHAPRASDRPKLRAVPGPRPPLARVPMLSIVFALVGLAAFLGLRSRPLPARAGLLLALSSFSILSRDVAVWTVERDVPALTASEARTVFAALHANVYRAFSAQTEDGIYELLEQSVDRALLDGLYADIYESLVLREEGGAFCRVERVELIDGTATVQPGTDRFSTDWQWRVHAAVSHYGHTHRRRDRYHARYTVRHDGHAWRILAIDVMERTREPVPEESDAEEGNEGQPKKANGPASADARSGAKAGRR